MDPPAVLDSPLLLELLGEHTPAVAEVGTPVVVGVGTPGVGADMVVVLL